MTGPETARRGDRLCLRHGPIELLIGADGADGGAREAAFAAAEARFDRLLEELVAELPALRSVGAAVSGPVALRMAAAVAPHAARGFVTPMAAVAGAVADEILAAMRAATVREGLPLRRAYVNNGGDIAIHLEGDARFELAMLRHGGGDLGRVSLAAEHGIGGVATSGTAGRSHSLGIADSVTVLARSAAEADAAATLIANAVDLPGHPAVDRRPARDLAPDSDLGDRPVTVSVGALGAGEVAAALDRGARAAREMLARGEIAGAALFLRGQSRVAGHAGAFAALEEA